MKIVLVSALASTFLWALVLSAPTPPRGNSGPRRSSRPTRRGVRPPNTEVPPGIGAPGMEAPLGTGAPGMGAPRRMGDPRRMGAPPRPDHRSTRVSMPNQRTFQLPDTLPKRPSVNPPPEPTPWGPSQEPVSMWSTAITAGTPDTPTPKRPKVPQVKPPRGDYQDIHAGSSQGYHGVSNPRNDHTAVTTQYSGQSDGVSIHTAVTTSGQSGGWRGGPHEHVVGSPDGSQGYGHDGVSRVDSTAVAEPSGYRRQSFDGSDRRRGKGPVIGNKRTQTMG